MSTVQHGDCALVVIDAQTDFYSADRVDVDQAAKECALDRTAWLCRVAAALEVPIVVTEEDAETNGPTAQQIVAVLPPGTPVFDKVVYGAADNPEIADAVAATGCTTVVLAGMETDVCVAHSAIGFIALGLRVVVVRDAVFSAGAAHGYGLSRLCQAGVELLSAKELYYDWMRDLPTTRAFERDHPAVADPPGFSL